MEFVVDFNLVWKLCYCVFFYGWVVSIFYSNCDGKCDMVIIIRKD